MTSRRFDTDALLEQMQEGRHEAFLAFHNRYRGRIYRYIVRQCGNNAPGRFAYTSVWAQLVDARQHCTSAKSLKLAFFRSLQRSLSSTMTKSSVSSQSTYLPKELEEEQSWSTVLIELLKKLPNELRKRFLFRYEIGLSPIAIAHIFQEKTTATERYLQEAEDQLWEGLSNAGCTKKISLDSLYRETRFIKPPTSWDQAVVDAIPNWLVDGVPKVLREPSPSSMDKQGSLKRLFGKKQGESSSHNLEEAPVEDSA